MCVCASWVSVLALNLPNGYGCSCPRRQAALLFVRTIAVLLTTLGWTAFYCISMVNCLPPETHICAVQQHRFQQLVSRKYNQVAMCAYYTTYKQWEERAVKKGPYFIFAPRPPKRLRKGQGTLKWIWRHLTKTFCFCLSFATACAFAAMNQEM